MKLGCGTLLYGAFELEVALAGIRQAGYAAIELAALREMASHLETGYPDGVYETVKKQIDDSGLVLESIGASTNVLDEEQRARFVQLMRIGEMLGAPAITTGSGGKPDDDASFKHVVNTFQQLTHVAQDTGVELSLKPHVGAAVYNTRTALQFMNEVDTTWVGLNVDASHLFRAGEVPEESIRLLWPFVKTARIRDCDDPNAQGPGPVNQQICGQGKLNLRGMLAGFKLVPQLQYVTLEIVGTKAQGLSLDEVQRTVEESKRCLDSIL